MTLFFLLCLLAFSIIIFRKGYVRLGRLTAGILFLIFILIGYGFLPNFLLSHLQTYPHADEVAWSQSNGIILLGGGSTKWPEKGGVSSNSFIYSRIFETARLYRDCKALEKSCKIITSGGDPFKNGIAEATILREELIALGVDSEDVVAEPESMNTYRNAEFVSVLLKTRDFESVFLVTSGFQMKRALLYFSNFNVAPQPAPSDFLSSRITYIPLATNLALMDISTHEYLGVLRFHLYNYLGWNTPLSP